MSYIGLSDLHFLSMNTFHLSYLTKKNKHFSSESRAWGDGWKPTLANKEKKITCDDQML